MRASILLLALLATTLPAFSADLEYVGGNRYHCTGSDCALFDSIQNARDDTLYVQRETQRLNRDYEAIYEKGIADGKAFKKDDE